jgi:hypothetical protein
MYGWRNCVRQNCAHKRQGDITIVAECSPSDPIGLSNATPARRHFSAVLGLVALTVVSTTHAAPTWTQGHISNVTVSGDTIMIQTDSALPDNCVGSAYGWMVIPSASKTMTALVLGLWLRGDISNVTVNVYSTGLVGGYCQINQIDPISPQQ